LKRKEDKLLQEKDDFMICDLKSSVLVLHAEKIENRCYYSILAGEKVKAKINRSGLLKVQQRNQNFNV